MSNTIYIALDLEATEMHPERGEIIELGAIKFTQERIVDRWSATVRPRGPVPFAITSLTGITEAEVRRAPPFAAVAPALAAFVRQHPIVGQSAWMDLDMLRAAGLNLINPVYDTFELATLLLPGLPAYSLRQIAERLGVPLPVEHRALADCTVTVEVFRRLLTQLQTFDAETLGEVARLTAEIKAPLSALFREIAREKTRAGFDSGLGALGMSIRQQLTSRASEGPASLDTLFMLPRQRPERLEPTGVDARIDLDQLHDLFAPDGVFARTFPGYEHRQQQLMMLDAVAHTFNEGGRLLVEAGTGTGKGFAYLLPAITYAVARGETVVVSTATINLQDQLFRKDIPDLQRVLATVAAETAGTLPAEAPRENGSRPPAPIPADFHAALLKGRANYLCLRRWFTMRKNAHPSQEDARLLVKTSFWLQGTDTGDRAELLLLPDEQIAWNHLAEHEGACVASHCVFQKRGQCFLYRARRNAESAQIVVVNHALLLSDLGTDGGVLPPYHHLIVDEAHHLEAEATRQFGFEIDAARIAQHLDALGRGSTGRGEGVLAELRARLNIAKGKAAREAKEKADATLESFTRALTAAREASVKLFALLAAFVERHSGEGSGYDQRLRLTDDLRASDDWRAVGEAWDVLQGPLLTIAEGLLTLIVALEPVGDEVEGREDLMMELTLAQRANAEIRLHASAAIGRPDAAMVYWVAAGSGRERVGLHAAPLHVGDKLEERLFATKRSVVLTSATLATEDSFAFVRERLHYSGARELRVPSPFDYRRNVLLYLADDIPEPGSPGYQKRLNDALVSLCAATEGRALILFTSYSALQTTYRAIKAPLEREGVLVLGQRIDGNPRQVLDRFRANPKAVLLGTSSFWEGVDVVGDALSVLVITKLPFAVPSDPVFAARSEQFDDPFLSYAVPGAILRFKQGFGRLIRSGGDRGVCAILDRRVLSKRYGRSFIDSLPPCTEARGPIDSLGQDAAGWLAR